MMQPDPTAEPAIDSQQQRHQDRDSQQQRHQEQLMMPLPPEARFWPQQPQPQPQVMVQQSHQQVNSADEIKTLWIGDLQHWMDDTDELLRETFRAIYPSVKGAKVITDKVTGRSKGYGFVTFGDGNEQARAITEMNGIFCSSRPMRIAPAITKQTTVYQQPYPPQVVELDPENDANNTTLFVGGLDPNVTVEMLMETFGRYGEFVHAKIPFGKRCGFVEFSNRASAELALQMLHGTVLGQRPIRLSWGRKKQVQCAGPFQTQQPDPNEWNGAYYGDGQGYNVGYGYVTQPQQTKPNTWSGIHYGGIQGSNADYGYATQPYNAGYAYATQP